MTVRGTLIAALLALAGTALAGCSGSSPASSAAPAPTVTVSPTGTAGPVGVPGVDPCALVSAAEAKAATGLADLEQKTQGDPTLCSYQGSAGFVDVIVASIHFDTAAVASEKSQLGVASTDIPGLGDAAFVANVEGNGVGEAWTHGVAISVRVMTTKTNTMVAVRALLQTAVGHVPA
jgi:hypothetical protein